MISIYITAPYPINFFFFLFRVLHQSHDINRLQSRRATRALARKPHRNREPCNNEHTDVIRIYVLAPAFSELSVLNFLRLKAKTP